MEPAKAKIRYTMHAYVVRVEKRFERVWNGGYGDKATFVDKDIGWWLLMTGSNEALFIGHEQPQLKHGDRIKIMIESFS